MADDASRPARRGSRTRFAAACIVGVGLPFAYYEARGSHLISWLWALPRGAPARVAAAGEYALPALAIVSALVWWIDRSPRAGRPIKLGVAVALPLALLYATYYFRNAFGPTGDGTGTWIRLAHSPFIMGSEPLGRWTHYWSFKFFTKPNARLALEMASVTAGALCIFGTRLLASSALPSASPSVVLLALVGVPTWLIYAGYIETT